jgi:branched-chain amino acid transport system permease protein
MRRAYLSFLASGIVLLMLGVGTSDYLAGLLTQGYTFAILTITADILWGLTGILTFGSSAMFGIGAYTVGAFFVHGNFGAWTVPMAVPTAICIATAVSVTLGWLVFYTRAKISQFYVSLVTLGLSVIFQQVAVYGGRLTGGSNGLSGFHVGLLAPRGWYCVAAVVLMGAFCAANAVSGSDLGLVLRAIKDHETRCRYLGINTSLVKMLTFAGCNAIACLSGCLYALHTTVVAPSLVDFLLATNVLIWITLGGKGTLLGPMLVAIAINVGAPTLNAMFPLYWQGILGLAFVIAVVNLPQGILPAVRDVFARGTRLIVRGSGRVDAVAGARPPIALVDIASRSDLQRSPAPAIGTDASGHSHSARDPVLEVENVTKHYGTFAAIKSVNFVARRRELISIVGPNGAGKTSLIRCISDGLERSEGSVRVFGNSIGRLPPDKIVRFGLGRKFQGASVFPGLSVGACILIASWKGRLPSVWRRSTTVQVASAAAAVLQSMRLPDVWNELAGDVSHGQRQALELAMVLALEPQLLLLDEPTAGLTKAERHEVGMLLQHLVNEYSLAVVLIEHDFNFVKQISTRMLVLHDGRILADGSVAEVAASDLVRDVYLGRQLEAAQ